MKVTKSTVIADARENHQDWSCEFIKRSPGEHEQTDINMISFKSSILATTKRKSFEELDRILSVLIPLYTTRELETSRS